ncbi:hypothetical protein [Apilactobacillus timberlakei]|uniref:hypothetical protein n=1 Tax=Apilactobacillus timberlakei TaxID=2008380 RepID=UPI001128D6A8|nr:hypothetical protein [Apilactobacillus timberlakei]
MPKIQTLNLKNRSYEVRDTLIEDLIVFDKLAMWNSRDSQGNNIISDTKNVDNWLLKILTIDLGLRYDDNIVLKYNAFHYYHLDLSNTDYTEDEKANIYYIFYGVNEFKPYYHNNKGGYVNVAGDRFARSYRFNGIGSYWVESERSFFGDILVGVEPEDQKPFSDSFHLLSLFYLALNGYSNFDDAANHEFKIEDAS